MPTQAKGHNDLDRRNLLLAAAFDYRVPGDVECSAEHDDREHGNAHEKVPVGAEPQGVCLSTFLQA